MLRKSFGLGLIIAGCTAVHALVPAMAWSAKKPAKTLPAPATDATKIVPGKIVVKDPQETMPPPEVCPVPRDGEAAADWRPPPIPPKDAGQAGGPMIDDGGKVAADWRPPPIPPKDAPGSDGEAASDWRPPPIPPLTDHASHGCIPQASESADWRPPPIPPK